MLGECLISLVLAWRVTSCHWLCDFFIANVDEVLGVLHVLSACKAETVGCNYCWRYV